MRNRIWGFLLAAVVAGAGIMALGGTLSSKFDVELYGYAKLDMVYDSQRTYVGDIMLFVLPEGDKKDDEFTMTARETRFGFKISGPEAPGGGKSSGRIEADFYGAGDADPANRTRLYLRLAYVDLAWDTFSIRAGQDWDTFITVVPKSVNLMYFGHQGSPGYRRPQLRLTKSAEIGAVKLTAKVAAHRQEIGTDLDGNKQDDGEDSGMPGAQANLIAETKLLTDKPARISISGLMARETVDVVLQGTNLVSKIDGTDFDSDLIMGSLYLPLHNMVALQGAYWVGQNLDAYECAMYQGINLALGREVSGQGGWAQLGFEPTAKLNLNVGYGFDDPDNKDLVGYKGLGGTASVPPRLKNEFIMGNVFYKLNDAVTLAMELSQVTTDYASGDAQDFRVHGAMYYYF